ncbi:MAG: hypothetical protein H0X71_00915 [Rubrobacter sp.]|nr:hypothetical protein [Rubrobacter sp.]
MVPQLGGKDETRIREDEIVEAEHEVERHEQAGGEREAPEDLGKGQRG